ncbi:MAG: polysaccharide biosynthesis/export family protein [Rikenellaceae bacterium]
MKRLIYILMLAMASCVPAQKLVYFEDMPSDTEHKITQNYEIRIQKDDLLGITISCETPELLIPFMQSSSTMKSSASMAGAASATAGVSQSGSSQTGYLVNTSGAIKFPILGSVQVEALTHTQLEAKITDLLIDGGYINNPTVSVNLLNFKVYFIGEAGVGALDVPSDRITIFEAISMSGDLTLYGLRDNISIIREGDGKRMVARVDVSSRDIFDSPYYYLQPNDMIYVEASDVKKRTSSDARSNFSWVFSAATTIISLITMIIALN